MSRARMLYEEYQDMTVFQMLQKNAGKFQERTMLSYWRDGKPCRSPTAVSSGMCSGWRHILTAWACAAAGS